MKMKKKLFPYELFELEAIEEWLNDWGTRGYRLKSLGNFAEFTVEEGKRFYYRARYLPDSHDGDGTVSWGNLYVYVRENPALLPPEPTAQEYEQACQAYVKPSRLVLTLIFTLGILRGTVRTAVDMAQSGQFLLTGLFAVSALLFLAAQIFRVTIPMKLQSGKELPKGSSKKYVKYIAIVSFLLLLAAVLVIELLL